MLEFFKILIRKELRLKKDIALSLGPVQCSLFRNLTPD